MTGRPGATQSKPSIQMRPGSVSVARARKSLLRILEESPLCALATIGPGGRAHVNTAYYAYSRDFLFVFLSDPRSAHARNLKRTRSAALAVFRSPQAWGGDDRGVQLFGVCSEARGRARREASRIYSARFPDYARWIEGRGISGAQAAQLRSYRLYRFVPRRFKILDEGEFGAALFAEGTFRRTR